MEFSVSKAIDKLRPSVTRKTYLNSSSTPSKSLIIPGIGHCLRNTSFTVALSQQKRNSGYHLTKKTEDVAEDAQIGSGESANDNESKNVNLDKILLHSMKHPKMIETSSVTFEKKPVKRQSQQGKGTEVPHKKQNVPSSQVKRSVPHKFSFF
ncbi:MAG: hypothetical protein FJ333_07760 [Sphingomonadales bacterium]|nr:hypothetical protein [Sphingomonadales bacterium]